MKKTLTLVMLIVCIMPEAMIAQKKPAAKPRRRTTAPAPAPTPNLDGAKKQIADQIANITRFVYIYGKITNGLEIAEDQVKRGETSPALAAQNQQAKQSIVANISGLRAGIDKVAMELRANDRLQVQYLKLTGATDAVANAQQLASAGQFDAAGKALILAVEKMTDTLIALK